MFSLSSLGFSVLCRGFARSFCTSLEEQLLLSVCKSIIPELSTKLHKGQCGRIGIIGGSQEYTGAPYFAAISALKVGSDLSHVFCPPDAATVIKSYSPELIVHPILLPNEPIVELSDWLERINCIVLGPGLGRRPEIGLVVGDIIEEIRRKQLPLVIDADGLFYVTERPDLVRGYHLAILTPNVVEFGRLYRALFHSDPTKEQLNSGSAAKAVSENLGNVTVMQKGPRDIITNGNKVLFCSRTGSPRRCGGQGDLLSGSMGTFAFWALLMSKQSHTNEFEEYGPSMIAACTASALTRECSRLAFEQFGRTTTTTDLIDCIQKAMNNLFPGTVM